MPNPTRRSSESSSPASPEFASTSLEERKKVARDIVSSFDPDVLPTEFQPNVYESITHQQSKRPSSEWTIAGNLQGTLIQWAVHDPQCWSVVNRCQTRNARVRLFTEKLWRRFQREFVRYDGLTDSTFSRGEMRSTVTGISQNIRRLANAAFLDIIDRLGSQGDTAKILVGVLEGICMRSTNLCPLRPGENQPRTLAELEISLFDSLIRRPAPDAPMFLLDALETACDILPGVVSGTQLENLGNILRNLNAPAPYRERLRRLSARASATQG